MLKADLSIIMNFNRFLSFALLPLLGISAWLSYDLYQLAAQQQLWGYRPLALFASGWTFLVLGVILLRAKLYSREAEWRRLGLAFMSGGLLGLGFPGILPFPALLFIGFIPLLVLEKELSEQPRAGNKVFVYAYVAFVTWNILTTWWVANSAMAAGIFAIAANSLFMAIVFWLFHRTRKAMPRSGYLSLVAYWLSFEYLHLNWDLTWPWLTLGNGFAQFPAWVQWYEYTGVFGGGLLILLMNILLFRQWQRYRMGAPANRREWAIAIGLVVLPSLWSLWRYSSYEEQGKTADVVVVQPNYEPHYEKFNIPDGIQIDHFLELSARLTDSLTDYVVFPETSFGFVETSQVNEYGPVIRMREFMRLFPKLKIITGLEAYHDFKSGEPHSDAVRLRNRGAQTVYFETMNAAVQLSNETEEVPLYKKSKLVPGPEKFPLKNILFFMEAAVDHLGGTTAGLATQRERSVFSSSSGRIGPAICYESVFGEYYTGYVRKGAQAIFIMTNDGWWDDTPGHRQHLQFASLRAIETRRSIARSANTGISAFINQRGDILQATPYGEDAVIRDKIHLNDAITFYVVWGDLIARIAVFTALLLLLNSVVRRRGDRQVIPVNQPVFTPQVA